MSNTFEEIDERPAPQRVFSGIVASSPIDLNGAFQVIIPATDPNLRWTVRFWQARNDIDLPQRGNSCLVNIDENNEVWVVAWWPF